MKTNIIVESSIAESPRVMQVRGIFDLTAERTSRVEWHVYLPIEERPWHIGLIVGPSGCGKSTIARRLFPELAQVDAVEERLRCGAVVDAFPEGMPIKDIVALLSAVGFSSPPAWLRPFHVLSTGQKFRVTLALLLSGAHLEARRVSEADLEARCVSEADLEARCVSEADLEARCVSEGVVADVASPSLTRRASNGASHRVVFDEYTSVVDRTVAQVGSAALAKVVRQRGQQFVAVTCHEDVEEWLQPDWVYRPAEGHFAWRRLRRRPAITLEIVRANASAWPLFAPHHYLSHDLAASAVCFLASWRGQPAAFSAWLPFLGGGPPARREHRTVTLPDFQGVGIGNALSDFAAALWVGLGFRAISTTTHPAMIRARLRSRNWRMHRPPSLAAGRERKLRRLRHATTRLTAGFEYIGPGLPRSVAKALLDFS